MRLLTIPNQSSVANAFLEFDKAGRMKPSTYYDRIVDVMKELCAVTASARKALRSVEACGAKGNLGIRTLQTKGSISAESAVAVVQKSCLQDEFGQYRKPACAITKAASYEHLELLAPLDAEHPHFEDVEDGLVGPGRAQLFGGRRMCQMPKITIRPAKAPALSATDVPPLHAESNPAIAKRPTARPPRAGMSKGKVQQAAQAPTRPRAASKGFFISGTLVVEGKAECKTSSNLRCKPHLMNHPKNSRAVGHRRSGAPNRAGRVGYPLLRRNWPDRACGSQGEWPSLLS